jgi:hypothetical protein
MSSSRAADRDVEKLGLDERLFGGHHRRTVYFIDEMKR